MNFRSLPYFLEFKTIENKLKFATQCWAERRPAATVSGVAACHARPAGRPAGPRPGGPAAEAARARDGAVARSPVARSSISAPSAHGGCVRQEKRRWGSPRGWHDGGVAESSSVDGDGAGTVVADGRGVLLQLGGGGQ
jgi:hypothetical protein